MQVTLFGWVYMPLLLAVAIWARPWLLGLVLGSAVFQAAAVVNIPVGGGFYGISPYVASAGVAGCVMLWRRFGPDKSAVWPPPAHIRTPAIWLLVYAAVAVVGSFVLPHVFAGLPVQPPLAANGYSLKEFPPLQWGISNLAQAANVCVHATVALFAWQAMGRADWSTKKALAPFAIACGITVVAGLHDRLALLNDWPRIASFWMSNGGYAMAGLDDVRWVNPKFKTEGGLHVLSYSRISSPFSEPSYGSAFFGALLCGLIASLLFTRVRTTLIAAAIVFVLSGLINSLGSTGFLAASIVIITIILWFSVSYAISKRMHTQNQRSHFTPAIALLLALGTFTAGAIVVASNHRDFSTAAHYMFVDKFRTLKDNARFHSDMRGFEVTAKSFGFGVGLGSTRTSSFISSLLSNTGMFGVGAFLIMIGTLARLYIRGRNLIGVHYFVASATGTSLLAAFIGIPDLNLPLLWAFLFLGFIFCPPLDAGAEAQAGNTR